MFHFFLTPSLQSVDAGVRETAYTFLHEIGHNIGAEYVNLQATAFFFFFYIAGMTSSKNTKAEDVMHKDS